jgi:hypothetical protein
MIASKNDFLKKVLTFKKIRLDFTKKNGEVAHRTVSFDPNFIGFAGADDNEKSTSGLVFWDFDKNGIRSCRFENITGYSPV